jgi:PhnB protein
MKLQTYLNFGGNCAEAFKYYEKHLGAKIGMLMTFDQMPGAQNLDPKTAKGVLHGTITIAGTNVMASDVPDGRYQPTRSCYLCIGVDSDAEAERIYNALSDGGEIFMKLEEQFFAYKYAQLRDKFGVSWMVIHEKPMRPPQ